MMKQTLIIIALCFLVACQADNKRKKSLIVVGVNSLSFESVPCASPSIDGFKALKQLCGESIRFTHAFSASPLAQPNMASLLTAKYPYEHGIRSNGREFLKEEHRTLAEIAHEQRYKTAFFSGGPPIFSKSGFSQGFELFDDYINFSDGQIFRPAAKVVDSFIRWFDQQVNRSPFFSVIYLPDLLFVKSRTVDSSGRERKRSFNSQLAELDQQLSKLIDFLKENNQWDQSTFVLVGLNGRSDKFRRVIKPLNLFSENTRVTMMIKPARKKRDLGIEWKIDKNVSIVDLGYTLFDVLQKIQHNKTSDTFEKISFKKIFKEPTTDWKNERPILIESGWSSWRGFSANRYAIRYGHYLIIFDENPKVYNSLTDQKEQTPVNIDRQFSYDFFFKMTDLLSLSGFNKWPGVLESITNKVLISSDFWRSTPHSKDSLIQIKHLVNKRDWDHQILGWLARIALIKKDWEELEELGMQSGNELWTWLASKHKGQSLEVNFKGCEVYFEDFKKWPNKKICNNELFINLLKWERTKKNSEKRLFFLKFQREFISERLNYLVNKNNYINQLSWQTDYEMLSGPSFVELYLSLKSKRKLRNEVKREFGSIWLETELP